MRGDIEVQDLATIVTQADEHEQHLERRRRHGIEVERHKLFRMIVEEATPALRGWPRRLIMYFETVASEISMPSLSNSPWIRGAPQSGLA